MPHQFFLILIFVRDRSALWHQLISYSRLNHVLFIKRCGACAKAGILQFMLEQSGKLNMG